MEGNPASSYVSHGINLTVTLLALRAAAVYNQTLETLSSLIFLKTSPEDRGPRRGGTKGRPVAPSAAARSTGGFGGSPTKSSIRAGNRHGTGRASGQFPSPAERAVTDLPVRLPLFQLWGPGVASREVKGLLRPRLPKTRATKSELPFPGRRHWARPAPPKGERGPRWAKGGGRGGSDSGRRSHPTAVSQPPGAWNWLCVEMRPLEKRLPCNETLRAGPTPAERCPYRRTQGHRDTRVHVHQGVAM